MDRDILLTQKMNISNYRETINRYLPFVLIRCSKYTNSKQLAEIIVIYTFICAYRLTEILDGANKMVILIDNMVGVVGEDFGNGPDTPVNGPLLFEQEDLLREAKALAEMDMKECLDEISLRKDITRIFDRSQFKRITTAVMDFLIKNSNQHLSVAKRQY